MAIILLSHSSVSKFPAIRTALRPLDLFVLLFPFVEFSCGGEKQGSDKDSVIRGKMEGA
jgi:hypothetical protein